MGEKTKVVHVTLFNVSFALGDKIHYLCTTSEAPIGGFARFFDVFKVFSTSLSVPFKWRMAIFQMAHGGKRRGVGKRNTLRIPYLKEW